MQIILEIAVSPAKSPSRPEDYQAILDTRFWVGKRFAGACLKIPKPPPRDKITIYGKILRKLHIAPKGSAWVRFRI